MRSARSGPTRPPWMCMDGVAVWDGVLCLVP